MKKGFAGYAERNSKSVRQDGVKSARRNTDGVDIEAQNEYLDDYEEYY